MKLPSEQKSSESFEQDTKKQEEHADVIKMSKWKRLTILFSVCYMGLPVIFWSTAVLAATVEVSSSFSTRPTTINTINAGVLVSMGLSSLLWLPIHKTIGRKTTIISASTLLCACSVGCNFVPNLRGFAALWIIGGTVGTYFLTAGQTILADVYEPTQRGTAIGIFQGCCVISNAMAPLMGSIIVTSTSWRRIYTLEAIMSLMNALLVWFLIPSDHAFGGQALARSAGPGRMQSLLQDFNPLNVFKQFFSLDVLFSNLGCGVLSFNQFSILTSVRHIVNPRFNLTSPAESGLFYLAPGVGFLMSSVIGGWTSDSVVKRYILWRGGKRLPKDRLNGIAPWILLVLPFGALLYGWALSKEVGGMALPIISSFIYAFGVMASFSTLNAYSGEVRPESRTEVISSKYLVQYCCSAVSTATVVHMIDRLGPGWSFTINSGLALVGGTLVMFIAWRRA